MIYHSIAIRTNLFVEFSKKGYRYRGRVMDPLGNVFLDYSEDFNLVGSILGKRAREILSYTRVPSESIGDEIEVPDERDFFEIVKRYGETFHELVHAHPDAVNRFFGNASFRCMDGFPSFKSEDLIFVSRRNVDKRYIDRKGFVAVRTGLPVRYFGKNKPSIDTPIHILLYEQYPNLRYILHSHAYIKNTPFTKNIIPCGAIEEAEEIRNIFPSKDERKFSVNLKGHGSLALTDSIEYLREIPYVAKEMPEIHLEYAGL